MSCCVMSGPSQILDYSLNQTVILDLKRTVILSHVTANDRFKNARSRDSAI